jgi:hypothetical protein
MIADTVITTDIVEVATLITLSVVLGLLIGIGLVIRK